MTNYLVTRHAGTQEWIRRQGLDIHQCVDHLDIDEIRAGDQVFGTLPVNLAAEVCALGGRYFHLSLVVPRSLRGVEISADEMEALGPSLEEYVVTKSVRSE